MHPGGGGLPQLAANERPASPPGSQPASVTVLPSSFIPAGGFAQFAGITSHSLRPAPRRAWPIWRWLAGGAIGVQSALTVLGMLVAVREQMVRAQHGSVMDAFLEVQRIEKLKDLWTRAMTVSVIATIATLLLWTYLTVRRASIRYPVGRHRPFFACLAWTTPACAAGVAKGYIATGLFNVVVFMVALLMIFAFWVAGLMLPFRYIRRASQCEDGFTGRGVNAWHVTFIAVYGSGLIYLLVAIARATDLIGDGVAGSVVLVQTVIAGVASIGWGWPAVIAMYHTDMATSGALYADSTTPSTP